MWVVGSVLIVDVCKCFLDEKTFCSFDFVCDYATTTKSQNPF